MRFLVDLDGVCCDTIPYWLSVYNEEHNDNLTPEDVTEWDLHNLVKPECGKNIYGYLDPPHVFSSLAQRPGCAEVLSEIKATGHDVVIVTAVHPTSRTAHNDKTIWVMKHLPFIGFKNIIAAHRKYLVAGDMLLDDSPENISHFPGLTCVFDWAYNRDVSSTHRVFDWYQFRDIYRLNYADKL